MRVRKHLAILIGIPIGFVLSIALISLAIAWRSPASIPLLSMFLAFISIATLFAVPSSFAPLLIIYVMVFGIISYKLWNRSSKTLLLASIGVTMIFSTLYAVISFLFIAALLVD